MIFLLFSATYEFLGEIQYSSHGTIDSLLLSAAGERIYGELVNQWRVEGITVRSVYAGMDGGNHMKIPMAQRVLLRSAEAKWALTCWAKDSGCLFIELPERLLSHWHRLSMLEMEPEERYVSLQAMRNSPFRLLNAWDQALNQMLATSPVS